MESKKILFYTGCKIIYYINIQRKHLNEWEILHILIFISIKFNKLI